MDKKERILCEAEKLFCEKGYYGLGLAELLKRCDIPKGSFYYFFPDGKIQLIQEALEHSYRKMQYGITHRIWVENTALASFEHMADHLAEGLTKKYHFGSLLLTMISIESVYLDERVNKTCAAIYADWQQMYAHHLMHFGFEEEESIIAAQAIFALIHGSMISSWIKQDPTDLMLAKKSLKSIIGDR